MADQDAPGGIPVSRADYDAAVFDLDGVVTRTASVHAASWKRLFDDYLRSHAERTGEPFRPFGMDDYRRYVDGLPRYDGVATFLQSRGIDLPRGDPSDDPERETVCGLGNRKNVLFARVLEDEGVEVFDTSVALIERMRAAGMETGLVSSSRNARTVLAEAGLGDLFDVIVDGNEAARLGLKGKPAPDTFLAAAERLGVPPARALMVEDALSGVQAGRAGGFGLVVGVARAGQREALAEAGADVVVDDLGRLAFVPEGAPSAPGDPARRGRKADTGESDMTEDEWTLRYDGFDPAAEGLREALCTLGNGVFATRGAAEEAEADDVHYPGTYMAGGYNRRVTELAGRQIENEDLVNLPNWLPLSFRPEGGDWLNLRRAEVREYFQELNLRQGVLERRMRVRDGAGRETSVASRRLVHMGSPNLAAIELTLRPENWSGRVEVRSALDGRVINAGVARYAQLDSKHLAGLETRPLGEDGVLLVVETNQSHIRIAEAARTRLYRDGEAAAVERDTVCEDELAAQHLSFAVERGRSVTVEKTVALHTGRDRAISEPADAAVRTLADAGRFDALLASHARAWAAIWDRGDMVLDRHLRRQMALRLHIFHLLQTVSPHAVDLDAGAPARGLHGEAYRGHVFWDELFILPYLNFHFPEISRALLLYRYRRLPEARRLAREAGQRGAMYPWQSGSSGREESQVLHLNPRSGRWTADNTELQRHVSAAVALNVWRYWQTTGDIGFMAEHGAEMMVEIARFWAGIATWDEAEGRYRILGVMGPDEFHDGYPWADRPGLDDNAYTNVMAAWVLARAKDALDLLPPGRRAELALQLGLGREEVEAWQRLARGMRVPFLENGVIAQFDGYDRLEDLDWDGYRARYGDIQRLDRILEAEGDTVNRYKASKQADVLMLFYLFSAEELRALFDQLGYRFEPAAIPRTIDYYLGRTSHGSTLSRVVHSWVLARSDRARSWELLAEALESDLADVQGGTTPEGIHLGAMAGSVDLVQRGQTGLEFSDDTLAISPCLPEEMRGLHLRLLYRGSWLHLDIGDGELALSAPHGWTGPRQIRVRDQTHAFGGGETLTFSCRLEEGGWRPALAAPERIPSEDPAAAAEAEPETETETETEEAARGFR